MSSLDRSRSEPGINPPLPLQTSSAALLDDAMMHNASSQVHSVPAFHGVGTGTPLTDSAQQYRFAFNTVQQPGYGGGMYDDPIHSHLKVVKSSKGNIGLDGVSRYGGMSTGFSSRGVGDIFRLEDQLANPPPPAPVPAPIAVAPPPQQEKVILKNEVNYAWQPEKWYVYEQEPFPRYQQQALPVYQQPNAPLVTTPTVGHQKGTGFQDWSKQADWQSEKWYVFEKEQFPAYQRSSPSSVSQQFSPTTQKSLAVSQQPSTHVHGFFQTAGQPMNQTIPTTWSYCV